MALTPNGLTPFVFEQADVSAFTNIWTSERGDTPISFYRYIGPQSGQALPLGDQAIIAYRNSPFPIQLVAPGVGDLQSLAHPVGFTWILDDHGSENPSSVSYWWPIAPAGYTALGLCLTTNAGGGGQPPIAGNYWCVADKYLINSGLQDIWSDAGQSWSSHNGSMSASQAPQDPASPSFIVPDGMLSDEYMSNTGGEFGFVINTSVLE